MTGEFGCASCYGEDAETVMSYCIANLRTSHQLISDSHFIVAIRDCPNCDQQFVTIFSERIDWDGGEDDQYFQVVPISAAEADGLRRDPAPTENDLIIGLGALGADRRHLVEDWPRASPKTFYWRYGTFTVREPD